MSRTGTTVPIAPTTRRWYAISLGLAVFFIFLQSLTAGVFISEAFSPHVQHVWLDLHGLIAYPIMVFALVAAVVATLRLAHVRLLALGTWVLFVASVVQWLLGHAISTLGMDWVTPFHVVLAFVVYGLAIWLSVRSAGLRRA
jgi:hypothetical protein